MSAPRPLAVPWRSAVMKAGLAVGLGYLVIACAFTLLTPAWENNDEGDHVHYAEYVLTHHTPPRIAFSNGIESHQPPLYYYVAAGWQKLLGIPAFMPQLQPPPGPFVPPLKRVWQLSHVYTPSQRRGATYDHALRFLSIGLGLVTVLAAVATGWLLTGRAAFAAALGATVGLWPKFVVVTSAVTNSALAIALCASAIPAFLLWRRSERVGWAAATGALLGAAALTSETALPVAGLVLLLLTVYAARRRDRRAPVAAVVCFAAICGWWYVHDAVVYGDPLAGMAARTYLLNVPGLVRSPATLSLSVLGSSLSALAHSTWYDGGANQLQLPHALDYVICGLALAAIGAGLTVRLNGRLLVATCALASFIAWLVIIRDTTQAEGRYVLVGIVAWAALLVTGTERITVGRGVALCLWPAVFVALDGYVLATWLLPYGRVWG